VLRRWETNHGVSLPSHFHIPQLLQCRFCAIRGDHSIQETGDSRLNNTDSRQHTTQNRKQIMLTTECRCPLTFSSPSFLGVGLCNENDGTQMSQKCYSSVTMVSHWCYSMLTTECRCPLTFSSPSFLVGDVTGKGRPEAGRGVAQTFLVSPDRKFARLALAAATSLAISRAFSHSFCSLRSDSANTWI
jgi:hypothetical protein